MKRLPPPSRLSRLQRMAHVICDADGSLENIKHRHRCRTSGCLIEGDVCVAYRQARAVLALVPEAQSIALRVATSGEPGAILAAGGNS